MSNGPSAFTIFDPSSISTASAAVGTADPRLPAPRTSPGATSAGLTTLRPLLSMNRISARSTPSSPPFKTIPTSCGKLRINPKSGRSRARSGRVTPPTTTISRQPASLNAARMRPTSPHPAHTTSKPASSAPASPSIPTMTTRPPRASIARATSPGNLPLPARMPIGGGSETGAASGSASVDIGASCRTRPLMHPRGAYTTTSCWARG